MCLEMLCDFEQNGYTAGPVVCAGDGIREKQPLSTLQRVREFLTPHSPGELSKLHPQKPQASIMTREAGPSRSESGLLQEILIRSLTVELFVELICRHAGYIWRDLPRGDLAWRVQQQQDA